MGERIRPTTLSDMRSAGSAGASDLVIAIDGPSGSGKSTAARAVAARLDLRYLDTGAMYRALTWWLLERGVDLTDTQWVADLAPELPLEMSLDPDTCSVCVDGRPVDLEIRQPVISAAVSEVATNLAVRAELVRRQQRIAEGGGIVLEGRDTTTVVVPDARVRVLLTANEQARLSRRALEVRGSDDTQAVDATRDEVLRRDRVDSTVAQFMEAPDGVFVVDTSALDAEQTADAVLELVARQTGVRA